MYFIIYRTLQDIEMSRGKPLYLNEERYAALTNMVLELYYYYFFIQYLVYKCTTDIALWKIFYLFSFNSKVKLFRLLFDIKVKLNFHCRYFMFDDM